MNSNPLFMICVGVFIVLTVICILIEPSTFAVAALIVAMTAIVCYFIYLDGD